MFDGTLIAIAWFDPDLVTITTVVVASTTTMAMII